MSTGIPFIEQFSALLGSVPSVVNTLSPAPSAEAFQAELSRALLSDDLVDGVDLQLDELTTPAVDVVSIDVDLSESLVMADDVLERVDVEVVSLEEPGKMVPVEGMLLVGANPTDTAADFTGEQGRIDLEVVPLPLGDELVADTESNVKPPFAGRDARSDWLPQARHGAPSSFLQNADGASPHMTESGVTGLAAEFGFSAFESTGDADEMVGGQVKDPFSRLDALSRDRTVHAVPQAEVGQGLGATVMAVQRTSSEIHPLIMSPPAASALKQTIQFMVNDQVPEAEIQLDPPELGSIMVKLKVENGQQAQIIFQSPHPSVRDLLSDHVERLRESLAEMGLDLGGVEVEVGSQGNDSSGQSLDHFANSSDESAEDINQLIANPNATEQDGRTEPATSITTNHLINERV